MSELHENGMNVPVRSIAADEMIEMNEFSVYARKALDNYMAGKLSLEEFVNKMQIRSMNDSFSFIPIQMKNKTVLNVNTNVNYFLLKPKDFQNKEDNSPYNNYYRCKYFGPFPIYKNGEEVKVISHNQNCFNYEPESFNVIFTNRFFKYLNDKDVVDFFACVLSWMKEDGYFIFNEPCMISTAMKNNNNNQKTTDVGDITISQQNLRSAACYLNTIESIRIIDEFGKDWQFYIDVSSSSPTYITYGMEWNYLMLRARKYRAHMKYVGLWKRNSFNRLTEKLTRHISLPNYYYQYADKTFADKIFANEIEEYDNKIKSQKFPGYIASAHFIFQNPKTFWYYRICPFRILTSYDTIIWCSEPSSDFYDYSINKANSLGNKRILFTYTNSHPIDALNAPCFTNYVVKVFISIDVLNNFTLGFNHFLKNIGMESTKIILLEPYKSKEEKNEKLKKVWSYVKYYTTKNMTKMVHNEVKHTALPDMWKDKVRSLEWMLITMEIQAF